jgi:hypothetical protein
MADAPGNRPRSNKRAAMMDDIDELIASAAADLDALARKLDRMRAISAQRQAAPIAAAAVIGEPDRRRLKLMSVGEAAGLSGLSKSRVRALCGAHVFEISPGGFGYKRGGRWEVATVLFLEFRRSARVSRV